MLAVLLDPDKCREQKYMKEILSSIKSSAVDFIFAGGSLITEGHFGITLQQIREHSGLPVIIFPGNVSQIHPAADAILLLSLISGRNPDLLIGQHVHGAVTLKQSGLEILPTGYILVESEKMTTAVYISQSLPVPRFKPEIAACTALAGEQLGLRLIYIDGGSGASGPIPEEMIRKVKEMVSVPIIAGGGITSPEEAEALWNAGADVVVIGTAAEKNPAILSTFKKR
jgi:phosphoglycerol geranylgeranyltransferase